MINNKLYQMIDRLQRIKVRGRIAFAFCFLVVVVQMILDGAGLANYTSEMGPNFDRSIGNRVCLTLDWMLFACFFVWGASEFRVRQSVLFHEGGGRVLPLVTGIAGLFVLFEASARLVSLPLSGEEFGFIDGWQFGVGWLLVWWSFVFRK